jgi:hypothetical protein
MKFLPGFILVFFATIFTGCFDILEDISVNKDGSGSYSLTFDMNEIMNDPFMKGMLLEMVKNEGSVDVGELENIAIDSTIYFREDPQFVKYKDNKTLWETAKMHMVVNEEKGKMFINFGFDYNNVEDIASFFKSFSESGDAQQMFAGFDQIVSGSTFVFKKKSLKRLPSSNNGDSLAANFNEEDLAMTKMFVANAKLKTSYHFPGRVKKSSIPNSVIENNKVSVDISLMDLMEGNAKMDGEIKFRN